MRKITLARQTGLALVLLALVFSSGCLYVAETPVPPTPTPCNPSPSLFELPPSVYQDYARGNNISPQDALKLLTTQVQRWTAFQDYSNGLALYRVTVTLISPDLYRAALINESVRLGLGGAAILDTLNKLDEQKREYDQLRFLVTVAYSQLPNVAVAAQTVTLPAKNMNMLDRTNTFVAATNAEGVFDFPLNVVKGPYSGYVQFHLDLNTCNPRLIIDESTSVTLKLADIKIGDSSNAQEMRWTIHLAPLLNVSRPILEPVQNPPTVPFANQVKVDPLNIPPSPSTTSSVPDAAYWQNLARYVWGQLTAHPAP